MNPKKKKLKNIRERALKELFPKGEEDIHAGTDEVLLILNNKINRNEARTIFIRSVSLSKISLQFDRERLTDHLKGYCLHHFNDSQIDQFLAYLNTLRIATILSGSSPSQVKRKGDGYTWL